ncbi:MAG: GNAT family N-acetyltransferase [Chloroflexi bacterium]|nr:GNAT family N-acetyltransferase [Chloroflexota bacterium]
MAIQVYPLTKERWNDLVDLFNRPGGSIVRGCWCMYYRKTGAHVGATAEGNKRALFSLVTRDHAPGLLAYHDGKAVGWVSISPREEYLRLERSPVMKPVDDKPVWSIVCFYVDPRERGKGITEALLEGAIKYARSQGARLVEAYPVDKAEKSHPDFMWFGAKTCPERSRRKIFDRAGFKEVARRKPTRPVMRRALRKKNTQRK